MKAIPAILLAMALTGCGKDKESKDSQGDKSKPAPARPSAPADAAPVAPSPPADAAAPAGPPAGEARNAALQALHDAAHCDVAASPWRPWCIAADGWAKATEAPLPAGVHALIGLTLALEAGKRVEDALQDDVHLAALAVDGDAGKLKVVGIKGEDAADQQMMMEAVAGVAIVLKGNAASAALPPDLATYVATLGAQAEYPLTKAGAGWTFRGAAPGELRKVGDYWVTIEGPGAGNEQFISIFTDKVK
ncbi:MAG TPA: hypothetical protein VL172_00540 [Kofleriaceae bacterium]|nr:hypothetical protein [Kofleriaceae bacterium]